VGSSQQQPGRQQRPSKNHVIDSNSLVRDVLVLDATVDESSNLDRGLLDVRGLLGDGELLEELVKDLDGLSVLGRHLV
jgi:hypothetical protein